jgi:hypothetical protein
VAGGDPRADRPGRAPVRGRTRRRLAQLGAGRGPRDRWPAPRCVRCRAGLLVERGELPRRRLRRLSMGPARPRRNGCRRSTSWARWARGSGMPSTTRGSGRSSGGKRSSSCRRARSGRSCPSWRGKRSGWMRSATAACSRASGSER